MNTDPRVNMVDRYEERPYVRLPDHTIYHRFQRTSISTVCGACPGRWDDPIHFDAPANYWRVGAWHQGRP